MSNLFIYLMILFDYSLRCRERKPGSIDVHPNIDAIVLNYEIDVQILGPKENIIHGEKKVLNSLLLKFKL